MTWEIGQRVKITDRNNTYFFTRYGSEGRIVGLNLHQNKVTVAFHHLTCSPVRQHSTASRTWEIYTAHLSIIPQDIPADATPNPRAEKTAAQLKVLDKIVQMDKR
jgi:phosphohistidine phosphatase SixA